MFVCGFSLLAILHMFTEYLPCACVLSALSVLNSFNPDDLR